MTINGNNIMDLSGEEKQIIWDSLYHYNRYTHDMAKTDHVAKETFKEINQKTTGIMEMIYDNWKDIIH